ncbi:unnamed protein product [Bemisia tabaci]|uniref:Cytochrome P450 n=1 Tax=Bemisia tabaci TaxID=7038 RepID=A0A9P0A110_BEMTA|nr:cytochrome P450 [Bemisia tabaci]CAH0381736.1 unnamed protein product [Bemisia tabaci]
MVLSPVTSWILHLAFLTFCASLVQWLVRYVQHLRRLPPGPYGLPVIGYLPWIDPKKPHITLTNLVSKYGKIYSLKFGNLTTVVLADPVLIREAFRKDVFSGRADLYVTHGIMEGYGLIVPEGERWKEQRQFAVSTLRDLGMVKFGAKRSHMEQRIMKGVQALFRSLDAFGGSDVDLTHPLFHSVGTVMYSLVLGKTWDHDDPMWIWLREKMEEGVQMMQVAGPINFLPWLRFIPKFRKMIEFLISGKKKEHALYEQFFKENQEILSEADSLATAYRLEMERRQDSPQGSHSFVREQCDHFLADLLGAGTDTTCTSIKWFLLLLVIHPQVQVEIQEELEHLECVDGLIGLEGMEDAVLLRAAFAESMRLRPLTTLGIPHATRAATDLAQFHIPERSMVIPLLWAINMDPQLWADPLEYRPRRFIDENGRFAKPDHFMPFQVGKRMCLGDELARMMTFLFCANVLHRYKITSPNTPEELQNALDGDCGLLYVPKKYVLNFHIRERNVDR